MHKKIPHKFRGKIMMWMLYWNAQDFLPIKTKAEAHIKGWCKKSCDIRACHWRSENNCV